MSLTASTSICAFRALACVANDLNVSLVYFEALVFEAGLLDGQDCG
jgi:hypothetical protein